MRRLSIVLLILILTLPAMAQEEERVLPYDALIRSARIYLGQKQKDYDMAQKRLQEAIDNYENPVEAYYWLGMIYSERAKYKEMIDAFAKYREICEKAQEDNDKDLKKRCSKDKMPDMIAKVTDEEWNKNFKWAVDHLKAADSIDAEVSNVADDSSKTAMKESVNKLLEKSRDEFNTAIMLDSTRFQAWANQAIVEKRVGDPDSALFYYRRAHELKPSDVDVLSGMASTLYEKKQFPEAVKYFEDMAEKDTTNAVWALTYAAICYQSMKHNDKFKETLDRILRIDPNNAQIRYQRGIYFVQAAAAPALRDSARLLDSLAQAKPKDKALAQARTDLTDYRLSLYKEALPDFKLAAESDTTEPDYRYWYGTAAFFSGDVDLARSIYEGCVQLDPDFADCWCGLESVYAQLKMQEKFEEAKEKCGD
jgi:tetratricopeptide (TPR) repeat protein